MTKIKLMTDYGCYPLWWVDGDKVGQVKAEKTKTIIGGRMSRPWFCAVYFSRERSPPVLLANFTSHQLTSNQQETRRMTLNNI